MPKGSKTGGDGPGAKAKQQKAQALKEKEQKSKAKNEKAEDANWAQGANVRGERRLQTELEKEEEKKQRAAEKKALLAQEEAELSNLKAPKGKARKAQNAKKKKNDFGALDEFIAAEEKEKAKKASARNRVSDMPDLGENLNRKKAAEEKEGIHSATGLENAIAALEVATASKGEIDMHPEKRMKGAFSAFEEARME